MKTAKCQKGGKNAVVQFQVVACSFGSILVAASKAGICFVALGDGPEVLVHELHCRLPEAQLIAGDQRFEQTVARVIDLLERPWLGHDLPLDVQGTTFQRKVWQSLCEIPCGQTTTYSEVARRIGNPKAVRAVAQACAANKLAVVIPCHRVVRKDGSLSGYEWGVERKRKLLELENSIT